MRECLIASGMYYLTLNMPCLILSAAQQPVIGWLGQAAA